LDASENNLIVEAGFLRALTVLRKMKRNGDKNKMGLNSNKWVRRTSVPGIAEMNFLAEELRKKGEELVNFGQAIPFYPPSREVLKLFREKIQADDIHRYSPDPGLASLRDDWCRILQEKFSLIVDPDTEILITAGANQAYLTAVMTLMNPGDRVGLISPWYFNHAMALSMTGVECVEIRLSEESGYQINPESILKIVDEKQIKAITLVTPNNPTGVTYNPQTVKALAEGLIARGVYLIVDETYAFFPEPGLRHFSPGVLEEHPDMVITIGSFSKTFALTGWRVGYMIADSDLIKEMLKVHDTMVICASRPGQVLVRICLEKAWSWLEDRYAELERRQVILNNYSARFAPWKVRSNGLFFAFIDGPIDGRIAVKKILEERGVILIPGDVFGSGLEKSFRLSAGCTGEPEFLRGLEKLSDFFGNYQAD